MALKRRKAFIRRGERHKWKKNEVTANSVTTKQCSIWRRAHALAVKARIVSQATKKKGEAAHWYNAEGLQLDQQKDAVVCKKGEEEGTNTIKDAGCGKGEGWFNNVAEQAH